MAEEFKMPKDRKVVYVYDLSDSAHQYRGKLLVKKEAQLAPGQTEVKPSGDSGVFYWNADGNNWATSLIIAYEITSDNHLGAIHRYPNGKTLAANETLVKPEDGLYEPTWDGSKWVGISAEEYYAKHPVEPAKPTPQQTAMANLMKDVALMKTSDKSQDNLNANVMKELADAKIQLQQQAKVNAMLMKDVAALKNASK